MPFPPAFNDTWDITQPFDTQLASMGASDFRNLKLDFMQRLSLLSGVLANRPTPETVNATWGGTGYGLLYFSTDTQQVFQWSGSAWVDVTANIGGGSAASLKTTGSPVNVGLNIPPTVGQVLIALSPTTSIWSKPAAAIWCGTSTGSANVQAITAPIAPLAYVAGDSYTFVAGFTNTGTATINVNGLGVVNLFKNTTRGNVALAAKDLVVGNTYTITHDGTNFQIGGADVPSVSLLANGYSFLPGGLVLQWGNFAFPDIPSGFPGDTGFTTFPIAFPSVCFGITFGIDVSTAAGNMQITSTGFSTTGFSWQVQEWSAATNPGVVHWLAFGS